MIRMNCRDNHPVSVGTTPGELGGPDLSSLCPDCVALLEYSLARIDACRFGSEKPTCARCSVHCYRPVMREQIRAAMRYSGPRMTYRHPYLAVRHVMDRRREPDDSG